ncbi:hypothetical protein Tco_1224230 [Tanacetum coccineum]
MCATAVAIIPGLFRRINNFQETLNVQARQARRQKFVIYLCHEVTEAAKDKVNLIEEVKQFGGRASTSDSMAYLRILRGEDMKKAKDIMNLIKETQAHNNGKYAFIANVKINRK